MGGHSRRRGGGGNRSVHDSVTAVVSGAGVAARALTVPGSVDCIVKATGQTPSAAGAAPVNTRI
ncbi:protein of unknown function [Burkholderia multivorans]